MVSETTKRPDTLDDVDEAVRAELRRLPRGPGVYLFRDARDEILYVGKAKSLRARVRSYFNQGADLRLGIDRMVARIRRIRWTMRSIPTRRSAPRLK